jgi:ureidoglycolate lyase
MDRVVRVKVELLTAEAFRPFGELLSAEARPADFRGLNSDGWKAAFGATGAPLIMTLSSRYSGMRFGKLERHLNVTQTFIPLGRVPAVVAVAAPTGDDPAAIPAPEEVRAFLLDGSAGYVLKRGTWHTLDRFPLYPPSAEIVIITSQDTQDELEGAPRETWRLTNEVDYTARFGVTFELAL